MDVGGLVVLYVSYCERQYILLCLQTIMKLGYFYWKQSHITLFYLLSVFCIKYSIIKKEKVSQMEFDGRGDRLNLWGGVVVGTRKMDNRGWTKGVYFSPIFSGRHKCMPQKNV